MTLSPYLRIYRLLAAAFAAGFGLGLLVAQAQAFTFDNTTNTNSDGSAKYTDPDSRFSSGGANGSGNGQSAYKFGNTTLQFGRQRSLTDERYYPDRAFNPNGRPGDAR
jgi:hypothetical protein